MENIIQLSDLASFIQRTNAEIDKGVAGAISSGVQGAQMPVEVKFDIVLVDKWQSLEIVGNETSETKGVEKQVSKDSKSSSVVDAQTTKDTTTTQANNSHVQNTDETTETTYA